MALSVVRTGRAADVPALTRVYNHYVLTSGATFDMAERTPEQQREWFDHHAPTGPHRLLVAEVSGDVVGWARR